MMGGVDPRTRKENSDSVFESLFRAHYTGVAAYVRHAWPGVDVDEVLSRTFEDAWTRLPDVPGASPRGWLIGVARNCARNASRSSRRRTLNEAFAATRTKTSAELNDRHIAVETMDALQVAFNGLRSADQEVLAFASWHGLNGDDLGAALGTSASTAAVRLFRARERLRARFDELEGST